MPNPSRRPLVFVSLSEVMPDVDRLLDRHATVGNWSLAQICGHLAMAINGSVEGYSGGAPWLVRRTIGPLIVRRILRTGRIPERVPLPGKFHPTPGTDARPAAESLRTAIGRFAAHDGPFARHPLGGRLDHAGWDRFHAIHCAHHLSFVVEAADR